MAALSGCFSCSWSPDRQTCHTNLDLQQQSWSARRHGGSDLSGSRSFKKVVSQVFAAAKETLLAEHEKALTEHVQKRAVPAYSDALQYSPAVGVTPVVGHGKCPQVPDVAGMPILVVPDVAEPVAFLGGVWVKSVQTQTLECSTPRASLATPLQSRQRSPSKTSNLSETRDGKARKQVTAAAEAVMREMEGMIDATSLAKFASRTKTFNAENLDGDLSAWRFRWMHDRALQKSILDTSMGFFILLNSCTIGLSADLEPDWRGWIMLDIIFTLIFIIEAILNVSLFGLTTYACGRDWKWHWFELALIVTSSVELGIATLGNTDETSDISIFRVVRLLRITRLLRICRVSFAKDLLMMVNGTIGGLKTLLWSCVLIAMPLYAVSMVLRETLGRKYERGEGSGAECFSSIGNAFFTMFRCVVAGDCTNALGQPIFVLVVDEYGHSFAVIYCLTIMFMSFGLFNVIVAIYVENTVAAAKYDEIQRQHDRLLNEHLIAEKTAELVKLIYTMYNSRDRQGHDLGYPLESPADALDIKITKSFFDTLVAQPQFKEILADLDVPEEEQYDLFDALDVDGGGTLDINELISGVSKMRGQARRSDIVAVMLGVRDIQGAMQSLMKASGLMMHHIHDKSELEAYD